MPHAGTVTHRPPDGWAADFAEPCSESFTAVVASAVKADLLALTLGVGDEPSVPKAALGRIAMAAVTKPSRKCLMSVLAGP